MKVTVINVNGKKDMGELEINPVDFGGKVNPQLLAQAYRVYESNSHQKTHSTKTRGEVAGTTKKAYRQKGTGRARHGARKAPIFVGGGITFGPTGVRPEKLVLPRKMKVRALASSLVDKLEGNAIAAVAGVAKLEGKTKNLVAFVEKLGAGNSSVVLVTSRSYEGLNRAARNLENLTLRTAGSLNVFEVMRADKLVLTKSSLEALKNRLKGLVAEPAPTPKKPAKKAQPATKKAVVKKVAAKEAK